MIITYSLAASLILIFFIANLCGVGKIDSYHLSFELTIQEITYRNQMHNKVQKLFEKENDRYNMDP